MTESHPSHSAPGAANLSGDTPRWAGGVLVGLTLLGALALTAALTPTVLEAKPSDAPREKLRRPRTHTDHRGMFKGPFKSGPAATRACLECHPQAGRDVLHTQHYTWLGKPHRVPGEGPNHAQEMRIGKRNLINNFCLSVESNWSRCTSCHAGYGWKDANFDFQDQTNIDCLVCHEQTGSYRKDLAGLPVAGTDLLRAAESVARPTRSNCGYCHFAGGGGDAVKHGDLDGTLANPPERLDVHMGRANLVCVDCHRSEKHEIFGQSMGVSTGEGKRIACTDCHSQTPHRNDRLNAHTGPVACVTCHVPFMALETPTKMVWDWSTAGQDTAQPDPHRYLKEKGSFVYASRVVPEYHWYDGRV
ncbi:MAG: cytochrome c3 family protein, partial [Myxococcales bacterium]